MQYRHHHIIALSLIWFVFGIFWHKQQMFPFQSPTVQQQAESPISLKEYEIIQQNEAKALESILSKIVQIIEQQKLSSATEQIDFIREFVYDNSIHKIDAEHRQYAWNTLRVLTMLYDFYHDHIHPPHLSCGPRALVMEAILQTVGIESRLVHIYTDNSRQLNGHTFLEVSNPDNHQWEVQDPDFNVYYTPQNANIRLSVMQLVFGNLDAVVPHSSEKQGWQENNVEHLKENYFEAVMYDKRRTNRISLALINTERFSPDTQFPENGMMTFYDIVDRKYEQPAFLLNQGLYSNYKD